MKNMKVIKMKEYNDNESKKIYDSLEAGFDRLDKSMNSFNNTLSNMYLFALGYTIFAGVYVWMGV